MAENIGWSDYDGGVDGFAGGLSAEDINNMNKALTPGSDINAPAVTAGQGFPLRVESLERTLKNLTYRMEHVKLWKNITKIAAYNTVEEHNELQSYGQNADATWIADGDLPVEDDSTYARRYAVVKYMATLRRVSLGMTLVKHAHQNVIAQETVNGTMLLLKAMERGLLRGDHNLDALQFDGYERLMLDNCPAANIIDLRGKTLSEDNLTDGALIISDAPNYGQATDFYLNPKVKADLCKTFFPKERHDTFDKNMDGLVGLDISGFTSPSGAVRFQSDVFIDDGGTYPAAAVGDATKIPAAPTMGSPTSPGASNPLFTADDAGDYLYKVVACNRYGKSVASATVTVTGVAAGDYVTFTATPSTAIAPSWYEIYRTPKNGAIATAKLISRVANTAALGAMTLTDYNASLPGCTNGYLFQQNAEAMSFKQLTPMLKVPFATIDFTMRWGQIIVGVPVLYAPGRVVLYRNIGRAVGSVGV